MDSPGALGMWSLTVLLVLIVVFWRRVVRPRGASMRSSTATSNCEYRLRRRGVGRSGCSRIGQAQEIGRRQFDGESGFSGADIDRLVVECGNVDECRKFLLGAEWAHCVRRKPEMLAAASGFASTAVSPPTAAATGNVIEDRVDGNDGADWTFIDEWIAVRKTRRGSSNDSCGRPQVGPASADTVSYWWIA